MKRSILLFVGVMSAMGCAAIFPAAPRSVLLQSQPPGATVSINGEVRGVTPLSLPLSCHPAPMVRMELAGFQGIEHPVPTQGQWDGRLGVYWPAETCVETFAVTLRPLEGGR